MKTPKILIRLANQLRSRGVKNSKAVARKKLHQFGLMKDGKLTPKGRKRNAMSPSQRAKSRAATKSGRSATSFKYNKRTNRARLKK